METKRPVESAETTGAFFGFRKTLFHCRFDPETLFTTSNVRKFKQLVMTFTLLL